jgi:hypothetical protein
MTLTVMMIFIAMIVFITGAYTYLPYITHTQLFIETN